MVLLADGGRSTVMDRADGVTGRICWTTERTGPVCWTRTTS